jgi:N-acetylmuramoyl-L-alanine amidase
MRYSKKKKRKKRRTFFLTFALVCMGLSVAMAFSMGKQADAPAILNSKAANTALPLISIHRQRHLRIYINVPIGEDDSWRVQNNILELTLSHADASAAFPAEEQPLDQHIGFRRQGGRVVVELELDKLPPVFYFMKTETGYAIKWLDAGLAGKRIAIDPGHGGHDPGAIGQYLRLEEKTVTLAIALELKAMLEQAGAEVFMTRSTDTIVDTTLQPGRHIGPDLWKRYELVSEYSPDFFISVHNNSWSDRFAYGIETYYNPNSLNAYHSKRAAKAVQDELIRELQRYNRGIKRKNDAVLQVDAPAVLAEILFISNKEEEAMLAAPDFAGRAAIALYEGIAAYFLDPGGE